MENKRQIERLIQELKTKKFREGEAKGLVETIGSEIQKQLTPAFEALGKDLTTQMQGAFKDAVSSIRIEGPKEQKFPEIPAPIVNVPAPVVNVPAPVVNVSPAAVNIPKTEFPEFPEFPKEFSLRGVDKLRPLPVVMVDEKGNRASFGGSDGVSTGGRGDFFTIADIRTSAGASVIDQIEGAVKVTGTVTVSGSTNSSQLIDSSALPYSQTNPLPIVNVGGAAGTSVSLVDPDGAYYNGGNLFSVRVSEIFGSTSSSLVNPDGRIKVELPSGSSGLTDTELRASSVPVEQVSGSIWSMYATGAAASFFAEISNPDGRVKVELPTGSSGLTDTELRASHLDVDQVSGSSWSVVVNSGTITAVTGITNSVAVVNLDRDGNPASAWQVYPAATGLNETNANILRTVQMTDSVSSVHLASQGVTIDVRQVSGASNSVTVVGPIAQGDEASALRIVHAGNSITSINFLQIGGVSVSTGNGTVGTGVQRVVVASNTTTAMVGTVASDTADDGAPPVKQGGIARTANPTAVAAGDRVSATFDDLGRQVMRPIQVRDLMQTAYVSISTGIETTLLAASAGAFHDLVMLTATNASSAAQIVHIRDVTAGNIVHTMYLPAETGPIGWAPAVPFPQSATGNNWTVNNAGTDVSNTTIYFTALFSREV